VPPLPIPGGGDRIVPIDNRARLAIGLLRKDELKVCPGFAHGMATVKAGTINADELAFIKA
jgi:non-heme chloroperoxidase